ncbi:MAG: excinuclease ABC subunit UvrA [Anaerolineae bacterium]|nr:excinuclease ABC subunit UvrA [Anaerolineae bacterium]
MEPQYITIRGAQQHNLKHIDVAIPRNKLVVLTGVSGSGKSSLAFDTIYAEGQRRYVESLSSFVRQFMRQAEKPKVDYIGGLSPAIAIEQKAVSRNPRSTVGTVTEVMDYLRILFARIGEMHCPTCGRRVQPQSAQQIADQIRDLEPGSRLQVLAPVARQRKGTHRDLLTQLRRDGYARARVDGVPVELDAGIKLEKTKQHTIEVVVDRLVVPNEPDADFETRLMDSVETALKAGDGNLLVEIVGNGELLFSEHNACVHCGISLPELSPQLFSFNSPIGMCPECNGLGSKLDVDPALIIHDPTLSVMDGALRWYGDIRKKKSKWQISQLTSIAHHYGVDLDRPWEELPERFRTVLIHGSGEERVHFEYHAEGDDSSWSGKSYRPVQGIVYHINRLFHQTQSEYTRRWYQSFMSEQPCSVCGGARLRLEAQGVTVGHRTLVQVGAMTIRDAHSWATGLNAGLGAEQRQIAEEVLKEIRDRLQFMLNVGLHYLTLDRSAPSLSGGESQRIRLASQIGCGLVGVLYILDEPSIGLHARDNRALLDTLVELRDMGNTVLVVEHDAETMETADWIVDLGPGAGVLGGEIVAEGTPDAVRANPSSLTGQYLSGTRAVTNPTDDRRRPLNGSLVLQGAGMHNLKHVDARFPLGVLTCVTGVSGSGKSSLVAETLHPALARDLNHADARPGPYGRIEGLDHLDKVIMITQDPIGRTPRSNPATYIELFNEIRDVFAATPEAKMRGYGSGRFSFNVKGGRCEECRGHGKKRVQMHFLPDVWVTCKECGGARYNRETLQIRFKGKSIADVLDMDVQEALVFFDAHPKLLRKLQTLHDVGLDYVKLGQSATTLSGGEAQRVKLAKELSRAATGRTLYILDEPTTGLHFADIQKLLDVLHRLTDAGNTVVVVEHNLDVIKTADWIIDLGPEGGDAGGYIIAQGPPEAVAQCEESYTGQVLRPVLEKAGAYPTTIEAGVLVTSPA